MSKSVSAIILAAGKGSRLGYPKIYAKYQDNYFLDILVEKLFAAGINDISVVTFPELEKHNYKYSAEIKWIINPSQNMGMIYSVYLGVRNEFVTDGYLIVPVDHPLISIESFKGVLREFYKSCSNIIKPRWNNKSGHPVLISSDVARSIPPFDYEGGLNKLISDNKYTIDYVDVDDEGITININTLDDLEKNSKDGAK